MQIGINGANPFDDAEQLRELGAQWLKFPCDVGDPKDGLLRTAEHCASMGIRCIVDVRTTPNAIRELSMEAFQRNAGDDIPGEVSKHLAEDMFRLVDGCRDAIKDWEWWGEPDCPHVTKGGFQAFDYGQSLREVYRAAKQADANCRVWTGGFGVNADIKFLERVHAAYCEACKLKIEWKRTECPNCHGPLHKGNGEYYDVCNLHHYAHARARDTVVNYYHGQLEKLRDLMSVSQRKRWIASSEWGLPTAPEEGPPIWLKSHVLTQGVQTVFEPDAPDWFDAMLHLFDLHETQVVCIHALRDRVPSPRGHWGDYCGLLTLYAMGGRSLLDEERQKAHWKTVQRWAHEGRETEVFDETSQAD